MLHFHITSENSLSGFAESDESFKKFSLFWCWENLFAWLISKAIKIECMKTMLDVE